MMTEAAVPPAERNVQVCPGCGGAGFYKLSVPVGHPEFGKLHRCECQDGKPTPEQVRWAARLNEELGALRRCTFENFHTDRRVSPIVIDGQEIDEEGQLAALGVAHLACLYYAGYLGGWIYLHGPVGSGKSHLAAAIANRAGERGISVAYASAPRLLDWVRDGYRDHSASSRLAALMDIDLLILDDLGAEAMTDKNEALFFDLLNERARYSRATVLTSNLNVDLLPVRIADRVYEQTGTDERIIWLPVSSYRRIGR